MKIKLKIISKFVICNLLIVFIVVGVFLVFFFSDDETVVASNLEYNGTIYKGDKNSGKISIMINVYWGTEYLLEMLETLKKNEVETTFFIGGTWAKDNPEILKKIVENGHEIGSHGYSHREHGKISYTENLTEIQKCHEIVRTITGIEMELFAPPGGSYSKNTTNAASDLGYKTIMWTRDTIDWRDHDKKLILSRAVVGMEAGDLILMHPTKESALALHDILIYAKNHKLLPSKVSETLGF